jgi:hypothetical protein
VLWAADRRERLVNDPLPLLKDHLSNVAFSPDGKTIAVGYGDLESGAGVALCDVDLSSWILKAERIANRNLTRGEWRQYLPDMPYHATFGNLPLPTDK